MNTPITVITVSLNVCGQLTDLIANLRMQTDLDFEWIIVDGASTDGTLKLLQSTDDIVSKWLSEPDFGIYDAMNKAVQLATGEYYLVLGADDRLKKDAIAQYKFYANKTKADIVTAKIIRNGKVERRKPCWPWLYAHHAFVSEHSVGTLIRRSLHQQFGFYSKRFPIGADLVFLKKVCTSHGIKIVNAEFVAGVFGFCGTSRIDRAGALCDYFRGQIETEKNKYFQLLIFLFKILKNAPNIVKSVSREK